jgi:uncharacterized protein (DUF2461 family)
VDEDTPSRRQAWTEGPDPSAASPVAPAHEWLSLSDDDLLFQIHALAPDHASDPDLVAIIKSSRHFYIRQEAAKRVRDPSRLREHWDDRHVGQILVRGLTRGEDIVYLQKLIAQSRHLDVRNAAQAQLEVLMKRLG